MEIVILSVSAALTVTFSVGRTPKYKAPEPCLESLVQDYFSPLLFRQVFLIANSNQ